MKKLLLITILCCSLSASAQQYSVRPGFKPLPNIGDSINQKTELYRAGSFLKKSVTYDMASIGCEVLSGITYCIGIKNDNKSAFNTVGTIFALGAVVCKITSINCKYKSGCNLQLSPTKISYNF